MSEWKKEILGDLFLVKNDKTKQLNSTVYQEVGKYPIVDQSINPICGYSDEASKLYEANLPVTIFGDHTRHVKYINFPFIAGADGTQILKPIFLDDKFFYYIILFASEKIGNYGYDRHLKHLKEFKADYPTNKTEQRKISYILSTADAVIEKTQAAIAKYKAIKQGMLHDLFTRGIDLQTCKLRPRYEDAPELYKESSLGFIPVEWEEKKLEKICSMKSGEGITSLSIQEIGDFPVYGGNGLRGFTTTFTHVGEFTLIGRQGALCGNITRVSGEFFASEHAVVVTEENEINVDWLSQKLDTMNLNQYSEASAQPGLSVNKILRLSISKLSFQEQEKIAERLLSIDQKLQTEQSYLHKLQQIKAGLMSDLLSGRVKVSESQM